jgi:actin-related protein
MESLDAKSMFLAPAPMLAAFSLGRQTALMVDLGAGGCRVTPVVDGLVLQHSQRRNGRGGEWLGNVTWKALLEEYDPPLALKPRCLLRDVGRNTTNVRSLFYRRAMSDLMYEVRTEPFVHLEEMDSDNIRVPFLPSSTKNGINPPSPSTPGTLGSTHTANSTDATYRLPDGTTVDLSSNFGKDLRQLPELLFAETLPFADESSSSSSTTDFLPTFSTAPLHKLVQESLLAVADVDVRKDLAGSICLTGGTSLLPHVETRLSQELSNMLPAFVKPKVVASRFSVERSCASWIGGSILTSLGSFQQLWLSRAEYEEYGAVLAIQRFP